MSSELRCPHCDTREFDSDWVYNNDLYNPELREKEIDCPKCGEKFYVNSWQSIGYDCEKKAEWLP